MSKLRSHVELLEKRKLAKKDESHMKTGDPDDIEYFFAMIGAS